MEKTIYIDDKPVLLKSTAATPLRYKAQFKKDYFGELLKLSKLFQGKEGEEFDLLNISFEDLNFLDFEIFYNFIWVLAKTANPSIPDPVTWLDGFDSIPIVEVFPEVTELLHGSIESKKK